MSSSGLAPAPFGPSRATLLPTHRPRPREPDAPSGRSRPLSLRERAGVRAESTSPSPALRATPPLGRGNRRSAAPHSTPRPGGSEPAGLTPAGAAEAPPLRLVFWELTDRCNLRCIHCRASAQPEASPDELTTQECLRLVDDIAEVGQPIVVLTGGEPLYRPDLFAIARKAAAAGLHVALATNGTLVDASVADSIMQVGIKRVSISFDGAAAQTHDLFRGMAGSFDQALQGLRLLRGRGMSVQINCTITQHNLAELDDIYAFAAAEQVDALHFFLLVPVGCGVQIAQEQQLEAAQYEQVLDWIYERSRQAPMHLRATCAPHYHRVLRQRAKAEGIEVAPATHGLAAMTKGCLAGTGVCFISHRGDVQPCGYLPLVAANVRQSALRRIWSSAPLFQSLRDDSQLGGKCGVCEYKRVCMGCRARAYYATGDFMAEEPFCLYVPRRLGSAQAQGAPHPNPLPGGEG